MELNFVSWNFGLKSVQIALYTFNYHYICTAYKQYHRLKGVMPFRKLPLEIRKFDTLRLFTKDLNKQFGPCE